MRFSSVRGINFTNYSKKWIAVGIAIGLVLPAAVWLIFRLLLWWLCIIGGVIIK